ncbi:MAG: gamma-glutamyltransferase [Candidatus Latescibacteria bacterium 4484_7]|nr:MAG: gamma-glutamyltransferase [Candidatus Latescibacteria bacterium 4484_7]
MPSLIMVLVLLFTPQATCSQMATEVCSDGGMIVSAYPLASKVGAQVLEMGGNAVDAAVAVGFALAVVYPQAGNIGGGGFSIIRTASGADYFVDFREKAPLAASRDMYLGGSGKVIEGASTIGIEAVGVPGTVAGLYLEHERFGSIPWLQLLRPSIDLARNGFEVSAELAASLNSLERYSERFPGLKKFYMVGGKHIEEGDTLRQPRLARTLELIAAEGKSAFYQGRVAGMIADEMKMGGGLITREDLASYRAVFRKPVEGSYRGYKILSAPPPSSGGTILLEILKILEGYDLTSCGPLSLQSVHLMVEAERRAFRDRAEYLGDPDFVENPVSRLISKEYADSLRRTITGNATPSSTLQGSFNIQVKEHLQTTHYSIIDCMGNAVATTTTLNSSYGSKVLVERGGFLLNNEMDDFSIKPGAPNIYGLVGNEANSIAPGKRMLSSMSPTIVLDGGKIFMILGTPGGSTIITTVAQIIVDVIDFRMSVSDAVSMPRFHHQWLPDEIFYEKNAFTEKEMEELKTMGYELSERSSIGDVQVIQVVDSIRCGVSDPRGMGEAASQWCR